MTFDEIRKNALKAWQEFTGRQCHKWGDDICNSYECDWQYMNKKHVSIFCSFGAWASCLSQQLQDTRYDNMDFSNKKNCETLYLYYIQVLLVVSEILSDLEEIYRQSIENPIKTKEIRSILSINYGYNINELASFINNIVKHKAEGDDKSNFHLCNHHIPIRFYDYPKTRRNSKSISVGNISPMSNMKSLLMPSLVTIIFTIAGAYETIDDLFQNDLNAYKRLAQKYEKHNKSFQGTLASSRP